MAKYNKADCRNNSHLAPSTPKGSVSRWISMLPREHRNHQRRKVANAVIRRARIKDQKAIVRRELSKVSPDKKVLQKARGALRGVR